MIWLIRTQALQIMRDSVHILTHALNNFYHPYGRQLIKATVTVYKTTNKEEQAQYQTTFYHDVQG